MKRFRWLILVLVAILPLVALAESTPVTTAVSPTVTSGQVTCDNTATQLRAAATGRNSITFQNHTATTVYVAPRSDITTGNAGILLNQYSSFTADRSSGDVAWYCIRASTDNAVVGYTEERQ